MWSINHYPAPTPAWLGWDVQKQRAEERTQGILCPPGAKKFECVMTVESGGIKLWQFGDTSLLCSGVTHVDC